MSSWYCSKDLNKVIRIQKRFDTSDGQGGQTTDWVDFAQCFAAAKPMRGAELWRQFQVQAVKPTCWTIRYREHVTEKMRVVFEGRIYNIRSIVDIEEAHRFLELYCEEGVGT
jgi:SPP1 family predicted phage head-tail adaptor